MSTTSGGDTNYMQENSVTTLYDGDKTVVNHRVSPPSSSHADSGLDNSYPESSAGDAKLIIDVPDFSTGIFFMIKLIFNMLKYFEELFDIPNLHILFFN